MTAVYGIAVLVGIVGLLAWIMMSAYAGNVGRPGADPEERFGLRGRVVVAAVLGFGMGGISAHYAGWPPFAAVIAAVVAAVAGSWYAVRFGGTADG
jgi:hypothetical protein